jgi:arginine decarboxylase
MRNAVQMAEEYGLKDAIKLFHFHIGSQISDIKTLKDAISEGGRIYAKLVKLGLHIEYFDVGGGLGVDYDGSRSDNESSMNYTIEEYATDIVWGLKQICDLEGVEHPNIVSESGRAVTAHHSCVITNVVDRISTAQTHFNTAKVTGEHHIVANMRELEESPLTNKNLQQTYNEALQLKEECLNAFKLGILSLHERARVETLFWKVAVKVAEATKTVDFIPEGLLSLNDDIAPQYLCNFSVFQSVADYWAIDQLLPVVPITHLLDRPDHDCSIADITCDSDGKIDRFIDREGVRKTVPLHSIKDGEDYLVGIFMTGAYQDVMGDMHNLFGRLNEVHVYSDPEDPQGFYIEEIVQGNSASSVLSSMQYNPEYMAHKIKKLVNKEVMRGIIAPREGVRLADFYEECLQSYTYLNITKDKTNE